MPKLNSFHRDALVLTGLMFFQILFGFLFPLHSITNGSTVEISRNIITFTVETPENTITYIPFLTLIYAGVLIALLFKKEKPFTLIYGIGLMLLTKVNFLNELNQLTGTQENLTTDGFFSTRVLVDGSLVAQDITFFVLLVLILIKVSIIIYQIYRKHAQKKNIQNQINPTSPS